MKISFLAAVAVVAAAFPAPAAQTPQASALDQRITSVTYQENNVVQVSATYGISTMVVFDEDEKFETISLGDTESWQVVPADKGNILFIKPTARNVTTNMNVVTTKRIYYLELRDFAPEDERKVFGIRFIYPEKNLDAVMRRQAEHRAAWPNISGMDRANVNMDYSYSGDARLKPLMVFDDGKKTFFKFSTRIPSIFAVDAGFSETLVNFRREGDLIVVDGSAPQFTLRDGNRWVCIFNLRRPGLGEPHADTLAPVVDPGATKRHWSAN
jgi:type IV secretion system protein VirB9